MIAQSTINSLQAFSREPNQVNRSRAGLAIAMDGSLNADKIRKVTSMLNLIQIGDAGVNDWKWFLTERI